MSRTSPERLPHASPPTLPVLATVADSYRGLFRNLGPLVRISWAWIAVLAIAFFLVLRRVSMFEPAATGGKALGDPVAVGLVVAGVLVMIVGFASIAVGWHRILLLDERTTAPFSLRIDGPVWRYIGYTILMLLIIWLVSLLAFIPLGVIAGAALPGADGNQAPSPGAFIAVTLVVVLGYLIAGLVAARIMLALPAAAVGDKLGIAGAFEKSSGFTWRLFWGAILVGAPALVLQIIISAVPGIMEGGIAGIVRDLVVSALSVVSGIAGIGFMSEAYRRLVGAPVA